MPDRTHRLLSLQSDIQHPWKLYLLSSLAGYKVMYIKGLASMAVHGEIGRYQMAFTTDGAPVSVLKAAVGQGFLGIALAKLNQLYDHLGLALHPRPKAENAMVYALVKLVWAEKSEEEIAEMVAKRGKKVEEPVPNVLTEDGA